MKIGSGNWTRYFASVLRVLAFTLAICATGGAWAAAPVAVWDGDFTATQEGFTLNRNGNAISQDNSTITIDQTVGITVEKDTDNISGGFTVLFKYSNLNLSLHAKQVLITTTLTSGGNAEARTGATINAAGLSCGMWNKASWNDSGTYNSLASAQESGVLCYRHYGSSNYSGEIGLQLYYLKSGTLTTIIDAGTLGSDNDKNIYKGVSIGGFKTAKDGFSPATGMKITGIAVFQGVLSEADIKAYVWPSAKVGGVANGAAKYTNWDYAPTNVLTCASGFNNFESPNYTTFDTHVGFDVTPAYNTSVSPVKWQCFAYSKAQNFDSNAYSAPGNVLRFATSGTSPQAKFAPLTIGGMIVESTATGCSLHASGGGTNRQTLFGDPTATTETWFRFDTNFSNARKGTTAIMGTANFEVNNGASVTLATDNKAQISGASEKATGENPTHTAGGVFKMHGNGSVTASQLDASDATLDFSDIGSRYNDTTAFINCPLVVNANTRFVFASGIAYPYTYKVAKSITSGSTIPTVYTVDGNTYTGVVSANKEDGSITIADLMSASAITVAGSLTISGTTSANITVTDGATLTVESTATLSGTISGAGIIIANGCVPATGAGFTGTLTINGGVGTFSTLTAINCSTLNINGLVGVAASSFDCEVNIAEGAMLYPAYGSAATTVTFSKTVANSGTINAQNTSGMSSTITALNINIGTARSAGTITAPNIVVNITATELASDNGTITFTGTNAHTYNYAIKHLDGVEIYNVSKDGSTSNSATLTYIATTGIACLDDWEFSGDKVSIGVNKTTMSDDGFSASNAIYTDGKIFRNNEELYIYAHPYSSSAALAYSDSWSAAIRCTTPKYANAAVMIFGSNSGGIGLIAGDNDNQVKLVRVINSDTHYEEIATMNVVNATTEQHLYMFNKYNAAHPTTGDTVSYVDVYCDGEIITRKIFNSVITINKGFQIASVLGGVYSTGLVACRIDVSPLQDQTASVKQSAVENAYIDFLRIYNSNLTQAQRNQMFAEYPYAPSAGSYSREVSETAIWEMSSAWTKDDESLATVPVAASKVKLKATTDTTVTVNQSEDATFYSLEFAGTGDVTLAAGDATKKLNASSVLVNTDTTVDCNAVDFSAARVSVADGKTLTFDFTDYPFSTVSGLGVTTIPVTGYIAVRDDDRFVVKVDDCPSYITSVVIAYDSESQSYVVRITPNHTNGEVKYKGGYWSSGSSLNVATTDTDASTIVLPGDTVVIPSGITGDNADRAYFDGDLPQNVSAIRVEKDYCFESDNDISAAILGGVTVTVAEGKTLTFGSHYHGLNLGAVTLNGPGSVKFDDTKNGYATDETAGTLSVSGAVSGTATINLETHNVSVDSSGSIANTISGSGTLTFAAVPSSALTFGTWTGTVSLPTITSVGSNGLNLNNYGVSASTVRVAGISSGAWLANAEVATKVELAGNVALSEFSATFANTFDKLSGTGSFSITKTGISDDSGNKYFLIKDVSAFTGSFSTSEAGIVLGGSDKPSTADYYGKIVVRGEMAPPTTANDVVATSTAVLNYAGDGTTSPISGNLHVDASAQFKFPEGASFPYKLANTLSGAANLPASSYTIGGVAGSSILTLGADGKAYMPTSAAFAGGEAAINWTDLVWSEPNYRGQSNVGKAECTVNVSANGTLALGTANAGKVTINLGDDASTVLTLTGTLTADEINITGSGTVVCSAAGTLQGTIKGASTVTISYPNHTLPSSGAIWTDTAWQGTLVLNNCGHLATEPHGARERVPFEKYGNAYSKIRAPGFKGFAAVANAATVADSYCAATLVLDPTDVFEFNHGWKNVDITDIYPADSGAGYKFAKLSGSGKLILDGTTDFAQYVFCDVSEFMGDVLITFPGEGGRKSYLFGADDVLTRSFPANLLIAEDKTITVAPGKTWDIPAGIIIDEDATLRLGGGSTITVLSSLSKGTLEVPSGSATLTNVMDSVMTTRLDIGSEAALNITDTSLTKLTIPADSTTVGEPAVARTYSNAGTLNLGSCTNLKELYLKLGEATPQSFDLTKVTLPNTCGDLYYNIGDKRDLSGYTLPAKQTSPIPNVTNICFYAVETAEEYANGGFVASNVVAGADLWLIRKNGALIHTAVSNINYRVYAGGRSFAGAACWHEWDFEQGGKEEYTNKLEDSGSFSTNTPPTGVTLLATGGDKSTDYDFVNVPVQGEDKCCLSIATHPHAEIEFGTTWSAAVRFQMPSTADQVGVAFGDTDNGMLGLASGENGFVDLFNWTSAEGGTYIPLAQFKVERPSDMHIYVFTVDGGNVSLYRDGEFIHRTAFSLNAEGLITQFKVGDVCGTRSELNYIPAAATDGLVDYIRLYDKVLPEEDIKGLSLRRPFVSGIDAFERTVTVEDDWMEANAWKWTKATTAEEALADAPNITNANVTVDSTDVVTLNLNIDYDIKYGTLKFEGTDTIGLTKAGKGKIGAEMMVVRSGAKLTVDCDAVDFSDSTVGVDDGATLTFDLVHFPFETVATTTNVTLIGYVPEAGIEDARARYRIALPTLPPYITSAVPEWVGNSYKITITPDHQAGTDAVYYKDGDFDATMTVYKEAGLANATKLFTGDIVVVNNGSEVNASVADSFCGDISVADSTTLTLTATGTLALDGRTITAYAGCEVHFKGGSYGAMTLVGPGTFFFDDDANVAGLAGTVGITVADDATLTLASTDFVTGGVTGACTIVLPNASGSIDLNKYGNEDSIVELTGLSDGALVNANVIPTLKIDGVVTIVPATGKDEEDRDIPLAYSFAKIRGNGTLAFTSDNTPISIEIGEIVDFSSTFTINNGSEREVEIARLSLAADVAFGAKVLTKAGSVVVEAVYVNDEPSDMVLSYESDGVYKAVAQYAGVGYKTLASAIAAASANLDDIVVFDTEAELSGDYELLTETMKITKRATIYTWVGGGSGSWTELSNWHFDVSTPASRLPDTMDSVVFSSSASVTLVGIVSIESVTIDGASNVEFSSGGPDAGVAGSVVLANVNASLTVGSGITLSDGEPTSGLGAYRIQEADGEDGKKIYSLVKKPGTIFSVY